MRSGFAGIVGRPNVGKSTLLNAIIGEKVAITSDKAQTTRNAIRGIYNEDGYQIVFIDTPGIHKPANSLGRYMTDTAVSTLNHSDVVCCDGVVTYGTVGHLPPLDQPEGIPYLIVEVTSLLAEVLVEEDIIAGRGREHHAHAHAVGAELLDKLDGVGAVAERLRHLTA